MNDKLSDVVTFEDKVSMMFDILVSNPRRDMVLVKKDSLNSFMSRDISRDNTYRADNLSQIVPTNRDTDRSCIVSDSRFESRRNS